MVAVTVGPATGLRESQPGHGGPVRIKGLFPLPALTLDIPPRRRIVLCQLDNPARVQHSVPTRAASPRSYSYSICLLSTHWRFPATHQSLFAAQQA